MEVLEDRRLMAVLQWSGDIPDGTVWGAQDIHRLTSNVRIPAGSTLTIQPGAIVKFDSFGVNFTVEGTLQAVGQPQQRIVFTERRDDVGGDTNGDGSSSSPSPGNWGQIAVAATGIANISHADIRFGGASAAGQISVDGGDLSLANSTISSSSADGVRIQNSNPTLTGNTYQNNVGAALSMDLSSDPDISGVTLNSNGLNGLQVDTGALTKSGAWNDPDIAYWLDHDVQVPAGMTLTIAPGQVVKASHFAVDLIVDGTLDARGTAESRITFTEGRDDSVGGDTNGNGSASSPGRGNFGRIELKGPDNRLENVDIRYGGFGTSAELIINGGELTASNLRVTESWTDGIRIQGADPTISNATIENNTNAAISMDLGSDPTISTVSIASNGINGLQVDTGELTRDGHWDDPDIVYWLDHDITVPAGRSLTVAAGQVIKFSHFAVDLLVAGTLDARGTADSPIVFTEHRDDTAGGDTNSNGNANAPAPGNWGRIDLTGSGNVLEHVDIRYGGFGAAAQTIITGGSTSITNSIFRNSNSDGIRVQSSNPTLTGIAFQNNVGAAVSMDLASDPTIAAVTLVNNGLNALQVDTGTLTQDGFWDDPDIAYWLDHDIVVPEGTKLTVTAGQVVKFSHFAVDLIVDGTLDAQGTAAAPIIFTESRDDSAKGDTNNDAAASVPGPGNWGAVLLQGADNVLDHVELRYGGFGSAGQLIVNGGEATITNAVIRNSSNDGVRIQNADPILHSIDLLNNSGAAASMDLGSSPDIRDVTINSNLINGLQVDAGSLTKSTSWDDQDIVYWLDHDITVPAGMSLHLAAGQIVKFSHFAVDLIVHGTLIAEGSPASPVILTESRDDASGGDTNGDGNASAPGRGNFGRVELNGDGNRLSFVDLKFGGFGSSGGLLLLSGDAQLSDVKVHESNSSGLVVYGGAEVRLENSLVHANSGHGIHVTDKAELVVVNSTIDGNFRGTVVEGRGSQLEVINSIVTNNTRAGVQALSRGAADVRFSDVFGNGPSEGNYNGLADLTGQVGNVSVDPLFVNRVEQNFRLQQSSPLIDAGTSVGAPGRDTEFRRRHDLAATPNSGDGTPNFFDLGPYEFGGSFLAVQHAPAGDQSQFISQVRFTFLSRMDTSSFSLADIVSFSGPGGPISATDFRWINPYQLDVAFPEQQQAGDYSLVLGVSVLDADGKPLNQDGDATAGETVEDRYQATWSIVPPRIVEHSPMDFVGGPINNVQIRFDRSMQQSSFSIVDDVIQFTGPNGPITPSGFVWTDPQTLEVQFSNQTALGFYELQLGSQIRDAGGNLLDQDADRIGGETPGDQYTASFTVADVFFVQGSIQQDTIWGGVVVVEDNVTIANNAKLTIQPGTVIKFSDNTSLTVNGGSTVDSQGTPAHPVRFTSIHDDVWGGDINSDGDRISPQAGDWNTIHIAGGTANFEATHFQYGGGSSSGTWNQSGMIRTTGEANVTISRSVLRDAFFDGVLTQGGTTVISNSVIAGADRGVVSWLSGASVQVIHSTFVDNRLGLLAHGGTLDVVNSIVSNSLEIGIDNDIDPDPVVRFTNIYTPDGTNTRGFTDPIGTNSNVSVDPRFKDLEGGNYRLQFQSPMIDSADGNATTATDHVTAPRYDDPRTANTGTAIPGGSFADRGAFEFVEGASSNIDLKSTSVGTVGSAIAGQIITVQWTIQNIGTEVAQGTWHDGVYLSSDATWSPDDILLGEVQRTGNLPVNQSYAASGEFTVPGVLPGNYRILVRANSDLALFEGTNIANNSLPAATPISLDVPALTLGTPQTATLGATGASAVYKLTVAAGADVKLELDGATGNVYELLARRGDIATAQHFDFRANAIGGADQTLFLPGGDGGTWYIRVLATASANALPVQLLATLLDFGVADVSPKEIGNGGFATLHLRGAEFAETDTVALRDQQGTLYPAGLVRVENSVSLHAEFDTQQLPVGQYDVVISHEGGGAATAAAKLQVVAGGAAPVAVVNLQGPAALRRGRPASYTATIHNPTNADMILPLLLFDSHGDANLGISRGSLGGSRLGIVPRGSSGSPGILAPGETWSITIIAEANSEATNPVSISLQTVNPSTDPVDLADFLPKFPLTPEQMYPTRPNEFRAFLNALTGPTYANLVLMAHTLAAEMLPNPGDNGFVVLEDVWRTGLMTIDYIVSNGLLDQYYAENGIDFGDPRGGGAGEHEPYPPECSSGGSNTVELTGTTFTTTCVGTSGRVRYITAGFVASQESYNGQWVDQMSQLLHCVYPNDTIKVINWQSGTQTGAGARALVGAAFYGKLGSAFGPWGTALGALGGGILGVANYYRVRANHTQLVGVDLARDIEASGSPENTFIYGHSLGAHIAGYAGRNLDGRVNTIFGFDPAGELFGGERDGLTPDAAQTTNGIFTSISFGHRGSHLVYGRDPSTVTQNTYYPPHMRWLVGAHAESYDWYLRKLQDQCNDIKDHTVPPDTDPILDAPTSPDRAPNDPDAGEFNSELDSELADSVDTTLVQSLDPNHMTGPAGFGPEGFLPPVTELPYLIEFENDPKKATAPAQVVIITNQLDEDMDWGTFELVDFGFGSKSISVPPGLSSYQQDVEYTNQDGSPLLVAVNIVLNREAGLLTATFTSLDPATGELPEDPFAGFLPVNDATHRGEGFVSYTIRPKAALPTGTQLTNLATIFFDDNAPLVTPTALNTIDAGGPSSQVTALAATSPSTFTVSWSGTDDANGSGVGTFDIYVSDNGGAFIPFQLGTSATSAPFTGVEGHTYQFYSVAIDNVGHREAHAATADTETTIVALPWRNPQNSRDATNDGVVVPLDVLVVINEINGRNWSHPITGLLNERTAEAKFFYDVNGDGFATPNDALNIINFLNSQVGEAESQSVSDSAILDSTMQSDPTLDWQLDDLVCPDPDREDWGRVNAAALAHLLSLETEDDDVEDFAWLWD